MVLFSPKTQFQEDAKQREEWAQIANSKILHKVLMTGIAELAARGFQPQEMVGANSLIAVILNLSEDAPLPKPLPSKPLTSFDSQTTTASIPAKK